VLDADDSAVPTNRRKSSKKKETVKRPAVWPTASGAGVPSKPKPKQISHKRAPIASTVSTLLQLFAIENPDATLVTSKCVIQPTVIQEHAIALSAIRRLRPVTQKEKKGLMGKQSMFNTVYLVLPVLNLAIFTSFRYFFAS
jgi:hypothetical protein